MNHGSLFSGIGGFDLAAEWMGWTNIFHCEWNPFGQKVLQHYWPNATSYHDITTTDFTVHNGHIDILTGGFPCQPYSQAGKRLGKADERHLWPHMLRAIREIRPTFVVGENVSGLLNWNGGMVFDEVQTELEVEGYEVQSFVLPACAVNAPHRRDRVWIVAHANGSRRPEVQDESKNVVNNKSVLTGWDNFPDLLFASGWASKRELRGDLRIDNGVSGQLVGGAVLDRQCESIKAYGNAIVPQVAYQIFKAIESTCHE